MIFERRTSLQSVGAALSAAKSVQLPVLSDSQMGHVAIAWAVPEWLSLQHERDTRPPATSRRQRAR